MKKAVFSFLFIASVLQGFSQGIVIPPTDSKEYAKMKAAGQIPAGTSIVSAVPSADIKVTPLADRKMPVGCNEIIPGGIPLMAPNDDGSTGLIALPFTFCFYGTNYTSCYVNNNGSISFVSPYGTFSSTSFPFSPNVMIAPFWADVDTRGTGSVIGTVFPTYMVVTWQGVGYYNTMTDKVNTFQVIITDGLDPILPSGFNIAFNYGDMQWTTGGASGGVGGFGGTATGASPATVGVNKGDGINYIQLGRFAQPGTFYDGGYGADDEVSWLDNQSFYFNVCASSGSSNIPPIASGLNNCDTMKICNLGDTLIVSGLFLSPELGQTTNVSIDLNGTPDATILGTTPGNNATGLVQIIATAANTGNNIITFTAWDDASPPDTTVINVNVFVDPTGLVLTPAISGDRDFCAGSSSLLTISPTTYDSYVWHNSSSGFSVTADSTGIYWCTVSESGCYRTTFADVNEHPYPTPAIVGNLFTCFSNNTALTVDSTNLYASYLWSNSSTNDSISVLSGTYSVTVTDYFGCTGTSSAVTVVNANPDVTITGVVPFCPEDSIVLNAVPTIPAGASYLWSNADNTSTTTVSTAGQVIVTVSYSNGCSAADTINTVQFASPTASFTSNPPGTSFPGQVVNFTDLSSIASGSIINWAWYFGDSLGIGSLIQNPSHVYNADGTYTVTLIVTSSDGCTDQYTFEFTVASLVIAPNVFTPNGDLDNEFLEFKNLDFFPGSSLTVYNRWGNKVFGNVDYQNNWNGGGQNDGVYYYVLENPKFKEPMAGFFQIVR